MPPLLMAAALLAPAADPAPVPPRTVTFQPAERADMPSLLQAIREQTGLTVEPPPGDPGAAIAIDKRPVWEAVQSAANALKCRLAVRDQGRKVVLVSHAGPPPPASTDGAFRVAVRAVECKTDFDTGRTVCDVGLDVHWQPTTPVFLIDGEPTVTAVADDRGSKIAAATARAKASPAGRLFATTVRLTGVPRAATKLTKLEGAFEVTASRELFTFAFDDLTAAAPEQSKEGVAATLLKVEAKGNRVVAEVKLRFAPGGPAFESFQVPALLAENRLVLVDPAGKVVEPTDSDYGEAADGVVSRYSFAAKDVPPGDRKGWSVRYTVPSPFATFPVRFALADIPLP